MSVLIVPLLVCLPIALGSVEAGDCPIGTTHGCGGEDAIEGQALLQQKAQRSSAEIVQPATLPEEPPFPGCPLPEDGIWCEVRLKNLPAFWMAARRGGDPVSMWVCEKGFWEHDDMSQFGTPGRLLDVGANMGYFSFAFAHAGWSINAFEPMDANLALMNATLCRNPELASKVQVNPIGLSTQSGRCMVVSPWSNIGNGFTKCDDDPEGPGPLAKGVPQGFKLRGEFDRRRLDAVLDEQQIASIDAVKIDVEGYEFQVFSGAGDFLNKYRPRFIRTEVWNDMTGSSGEGYLNFLASSGYAFFLDGQCQVPMDAVGEVKRLGSINIFACSTVGR